MQKVVLGFSGGLDTSVLIKLIKEKYHAEVFTVTVDIGQHEDLDIIRQKALTLGAREAYLINAQEEFAEQYVLPSLWSNGLYENVYPLGTALGRPLIAKYLVMIARQVGADCIAHGCTGKGNDQVRFEAAISILNPTSSILAPLREQQLSRNDEIEYALQHNIPIQPKVNNYSIDENLWGRSIECGDLEHEYCEPPEDAFTWTKAPNNAPDTPIALEIGFEAGRPVTINSKRMTIVDLISMLNSLGGTYGVGRIDHIESRLVGIKSREVYEAPAAIILIKAHQDLEKLVLTRDILHFKPLIESTFAELVYDGLWFSPLRKALSLFIEETQRHVTGAVKVKLYKGFVHVVGRYSEKSLYVKNLATYEGVSEFDARAAKGFIDIWTLPHKVYAQVHNPIKCENSLRVGDKYGCDMAKTIQ